MICDGSCEPHVGEVQHVHVWYGTFDWGTFLYCDAAQHEDKQRGLTVEIVELGEGRNVSVGPTLERTHETTKPNL